MSGRACSTIKLILLDAIIFFMYKMTTQTSKNVTCITLNKATVTTVLTFNIKLNPYTYHQLKQDRGYNFGGLAEAAFCYAVKESVEDRLHKDIKVRDQYQVCCVSGGVASDGKFNIVIQGAPSKGKVEGSLKAAALALVPKSSAVKELCKKMIGSEGGKDVPIKSAVDVYESVASKFAKAVESCTIAIIGKIAYKDGETGGKKITGAEKLNKFAASLNEKLASSAERLARVSSASAPSFPSVTFNAGDHFAERMSVSGLGAMAFVVLDYYAKSNNSLVLFGDYIYFSKRASGVDKKAFERYAENVLGKLKSNAGCALAYYAAPMTCFTTAELKAVCGDLKKSDIVAALSKSISAI